MEIGEIVTIIKNYNTIPHSQIYSHINIMVLPYGNLIGFKGIINYIPLNNNDGLIEVDILYENSISSADINLVSNVRVVGSTLNKPNGAYYVIDDELYFTNQYGTSTNKFTIFDNKICTIGELRVNLKDNSYYIL